MVAQNPGDRERPPLSPLQSVGGALAALGAAIALPNTAEVMSKAAMDRTPKETLADVFIELTPENLSQMPAFPI
jgi:hypothetical protein